MIEQTTYPRFWKRIKVKCENKGCRKIFDYSVWLKMSNKFYVVTTCPYCKRITKVEFTKCSKGFLKRKK